MFPQMTFAAALFVAAGAAQITFVDYLPTPPSLQELASQSDVVVHGIVQEVSAPRSNDRGVNRGLTITVKELLKGNAQARGRSTLTVEQAGGTVTTNGHTHSQQFKSPPLLEGEEVVLFLDDVAADLPLQILYGPGGIVRVATATGVVSAEPGVSFVEIVPGKTSLGDLLQSLRRSIASTR